MSVADRLLIDRAKEIARSKRNLKAIGQSTNDGKLDVRCWCERVIVRVPIELIRQGETLTCGTKLCYQVKWEFISEQRRREDTSPG